MVTPGRIRDAGGFLRNVALSLSIGTAASRGRDREEDQSWMRGREGQRVVSAGRSVSARVCAEEQTVAGIHLYVGMGGWVG